MKTNGASALLVSAALVLTAGCAKKRFDDLPPAPIGSGLDDGIASTVVADPMDRLHREFVAEAGSDTVYFDTDSSLLDDQSRAVLSAQAAWLARYPDLHVTIEGHCDERGTREYNLALGERRANAAKNHLAARGVAAERMRTISWGKERPVAPGSDEASWAQNRRAVTVLPTSR